MHTQTSPFPSKNCILLDMYIKQCKQPATQMPYLSPPEDCSAATHVTYNRLEIPDKRVVDSLAYCVFVYKIPNYILVIYGWCEHLGLVNIPL